MHVHDEHSKLRSVFDRSEQYIDTENTVRKYEKSTDTKKESSEELRYLNFERVCIKQ